MNVESLKSELQQVLDNDVVLRKEFNTLKRSLSDYRNQLIMRDEDCKRLQVTIDVLNTKLVVMERDNTNYKEELTSFKELKGTIKEQLQTKQDEIEARLTEIQSLRDDLNTMAASYESQIEEIRNEAGIELNRVKEEYSAQIHELKTNTHYKESGIKEEYENRVSQLSISWAEKEHSLTLNHEEAIIVLKETHAREIATLNSTNEEVLSQLEESHTQKMGTLERNYREEIQHLRYALEEQRSTLTNNFNSQVENLKADASYHENQASARFEKQLEDMRLSQESLLNETISRYENRITALIAEYEEKLSNTLIHSNAQNSKLNEELTRIQAENNGSIGKMQALFDELASKHATVADLTSKLNTAELQWHEEAGKFKDLNAEFEGFRQNASLSVSEQVNELNQQIASLNLSHSDYVEELNSQIDNLNLELKNMGLLLETTTNTLSEAESGLELKTQELAQANLQIDELNARIESFQGSFTDQELELQAYKAEIENSSKEELKLKEIEYQKLLAENTNLIEEIDLAQDKLEAQEAEISLLKGELEEVRLQSIGKSEYFKETLANRNFEITNLEANNAALTQELQQVKNEVSVLRDQVQHSSQANVQVAVLQQNFDIVSAEKVSLSAEIDVLQSVISGLNESILSMNEKIISYEAEIESLRKTANAEEQEAFIDKLFKQIDALNDEKLALLDEKEQMAGQLLKMNGMIGSISQQVDSEQIDVRGLNNHRKNVILANNSGGTNENTQMKEQINDLVREIDKCIALLSA